MSDAVLTPSRIAERRSLQLRTHWTSQLARLLRGAVPTAIGLVILIVMLFPVLWLVDTSFKDDIAARAIPPQWLPARPTLGVYQAFFAGDAGAAVTRELQHWYLFVLNSIYTAALPALLATIIGTLAGYGFASIIIETQSKYTATVGLVRQMGQMGTSFNVIGAAATMMALPILAILMLMQKEFVRGMTAGALKDA